MCGECSLSVLCEEGRCVFFEFYLIWRGDDGGDGPALCFVTDVERGASEAIARHGFHHFCHLADGREAGGATACHRFAVPVDVGHDDVGFGDSVSVVHRS